MPPQNQSLFTALTSPPVVGGGVRQRSGAPNTNTTRRRIAEALIRAGSSGAPVASGTAGLVQALNRGLQGAIGGFQLDQARRSEEQMRQAQAQAQAAQNDPLRPFRSRATAGQQFGLEGDTLNRFALTGKLEDADGGGSTFGKTGAIFHDQATGRAFTVQFDDQGNRRILPVEFEGTGLQPSRPVKTIDTGTGTQVISGATGAPLREVSKDVAGESAQRKIGEAQAAARERLPGLQSNTTISLSAIDRLLANPKIESGFRTSTGLSSNLPSLSGDARRFDADLAQLTGQAFLQARTQLKGGGHITDFEGLKGEQAVARLQAAQSSKDFKAALTDLRQIVTTGLKNARDVAAGRAQPRAEPSFDQAPTSQAPRQPSSGKSGVPRAALDFLRQNANNPDVVRQFDELFGQGAAQRLLGVRRAGQ